MLTRGSPPGVAYQRADATRNAPVVLRTDIAAMIGLAERGPLDQPLPLESWAQFVAHFGAPLPGAHLAHAVHGFFANGGRRVWVVRVAARQFGETAFGGAQAAQVIVRDRLGRPAWRFAASTPGSWGNGLRLSLVRERPVWQRALTVDPQGLTLASTTGCAAGDLIELEASDGARATRVLVEVDPTRRRIAWVAADPRRRDAAQQPWLQAQAVARVSVRRVVYRVTLERDGRWLASWSDVHLPATHPRGLCTLFAPPYGRAAERLRQPPPAEQSPPLPTPGWLEVQPLEGALDSLEVLPELPDAVAMDGGSDGLAALRADDFLGAEVAPAMSDTMRTRALRGLASLAELEQVALVAIPDILAEPADDPPYEPVVPGAPGCQPCPAPEPPCAVHQPRAAAERPPRFAEADIARVQSALLADCEARLRFALLDAPRARACSPAAGTRMLVDWRSLLVADSPQRAGALLAPWLAVPANINAGASPPREDAIRLLPACGHVLGALARTDWASGPMRPPANLELSDAVDARVALSAAQHGELNEAGINVIRCAGGAALGSAPWLQGARTVSDDPDWRYVHVVRLVQALRRAFDLALRWAVFEPNSDDTRATVAATLGAILALFHQRGAFAGIAAEDAYWVRCDEDTSDADARDRGELIALVGIAPVAPAEFIVLRVGRQSNLPQVALAGDALEASI